MIIAYNPTFNGLSEHYSSTAGSLVRGARQVRTKDGRGRKEGHHDITTRHRDEHMK